MAQVRPGKAKGRPSADKRRTVVNDLIAAAEACVRESSHLDLTEKNIAERAGASVAMIHYYFGDKDGLLIAMMQKCIDEAYEELCRIEKTILEIQGNPTRILIDVVDRLNSVHIAVTRIGLPEMMRSNSRLGEFYVSGQDARTFAKTCDIVRRLVDAGVYAPNTNVSFAVTSIISLMVAPIWQSQMLATRAGAPENFHSEEWLSYVVDLLDGQLRPDIRSQRAQAQQAGGQSSTPRAPRRSIGDPDE